MSLPERFRAFLATKTDQEVERAVVDFAAGDLPSDGAAIAVEWSSINYKDALAARPKGQVARVSPLIAGIDLAGTLVEAAGGMAAGTPVLAHGYDIGVSRHGGYAEYATVPVEWVIPLPDGLTTRDAMAIGTAGYTAALSVVALEDHGCSPGDGPVLVTGATGGVGSIAIDLLAARGWEVVASTGKPEAAAQLRALGASDVVDRASLEQAGRPLDKMEWAAAVDCVGGQTLATVLTRIKNFGAVAASGLTGGGDLPTTVMPFILRGVSLLGIDSVLTPPDRRRAVWGRLATDLRPRHLDAIGVDVVGLDGIDDVMTTLLAGTHTGRTLVDVRR